MKRFSIGLAAFSILIFAASLFTSVYADTLEVLPLDHDFGDVEVGTSVMTIVSMTNINGSDVLVYGLGFQAGSSSDFSVSSCPPLPFIVVPGETVEVMVAFTPSATGYVTAVLQIESTDSLNPVHEVFLGGAGVGTPPDPVTIQAILEFYDASIAAGTLDGTGPSDQSRIAKQKVFRFILVSAGTLIEGGYYELACHVLENAFIRSDGLLSPKDFVQGDALAELNGMIGQLRADLGCE